MKQLLSKRPSKTQREKEILLALVELYLETGKPIGSNTLMKLSCQDLSSATIRNYFTSLEEEGFLSQQHSSGGRTPTYRAFRVYADSYAFPSDRELKAPFFEQSKKINTLLQNLANELSDETKCATFVTSPRFDQDFIDQVKFIPLEDDKLLVIIITDFGQIKTETISSQITLSKELVKQAENYFLWRLNKGDRPDFSIEASQKFAQRVYTEVMLRHAAHFTGFYKEDLIKTGLCKLITYPELDNATTLSNILRFFEQEPILRQIMKKTYEEKKLSSWIGKELSDFCNEISECSIISIPYFINQEPAGAIALLGPLRLNYHDIFTKLHLFSQSLSQTLTKSTNKFKISFQPPYEDKEDKTNIDISSSLLLENKST